MKYQILCLHPLTVRQILGMILVGQNWSSQKIFFNLKAFNKIFIMLE